MKPIEDKIYEEVVRSLPDLAGRCYAITGTTSGTGFWTAVAALRKGASCVLLLNRKSRRADAAEEKVRAESSAGQLLVSVDCDLQSFASVRRAAAEVEAVAAKLGGLDGLVNNAGIMAVPDQRTVDGYEAQMQTNHLSHFLLTRLLLPSLEAAAISRGEARVVQHSSGARTGRGGLEAAFFQRSEPGTLGGDGRAACQNRYHHSKLANPVFAMALHDKLAAAGSKVKSLCAEPGTAMTSLLNNTLAQHAAVGTKDSEKPRPLSEGGLKFQLTSAADGACPLVTASFASAAASGDFYLPPGYLEGSAAGLPVKCIAAGRPVPASGKAKALFQEEQLTMSQENRALLWEQSEKATGAFTLRDVSKL